MMSKLRLGWHIIVLWLFKSHFEDVLAQAVHPEFGLIWQEGEVGWRLLDSAYAIGYNAGVNEVIREHTGLNEIKSTPVEKSKPS